MSAQNKSLILMAGKIGLSDEPQVCRKALEYLRLIESKTTNGISVSDNSKYVLCLELAANTLHIPIDVVTAVKYSGMKKPTYINSKKMFEKLLEINENLTLKAICLKHECLSALSLAESIIKKAKETNFVDVDYNQPQYLCMAVYQACRISKMKVSKSKLQESSRLKPILWNRLSIQWTSFVDKHFDKSNKNVKLPVDDIDMNSEDKPTEANAKDQEVKHEDYDTWKSRIIREAKSEIERLLPNSPKKQAVNRVIEKLDSMASPKRSSPRKQTPNKSQLEYSPVKLVIRVVPRKSPRKLDIQSNVKQSPKTKLMF